MTAAERADRARRIAERKAAAGLTWEQLATEFGVSVSTARRAAESHARGTARLQAPTASEVVRTAERPGELDPEALFVSVIEMHEQVMSDLAAVAGSSTNDSAKVGALKARLLAGRQLVVLLASVGLLPDANRVLLARAHASRARTLARDQGAALIGADL